MNIKKIGYIGYFLACFLAAFWVLRSGFVPLFILMALLLGLAFASFSKKDVKPGVTSYKTLILTVAIAIFGFFSIQAFQQYVSPKKDVYKNIDYHAIRVDGISIPDWNNFVLAGNTNYAFFDKTTYTGTITIRDTVQGGVRLNLNRFSEPVYRIEGKSMRVFTLLNATSLLSFHDNDVVQLVHRDGTRESTIEFQIQPGHVNYSRWNPFKHDLDTAVYLFNGDAASLETRFLKSGLPLSSLMSGIAPEFDPVGVQVFRGKFDYDVKGRDVDTVYADKPYYLSFTSESGVSDVRINGIPARQSENETIVISYGEPFCIGFGTEKSETMCFGRHDGSLTLEYYLPRYQYLSANNPDVEDQTLMVTTSLFDTNENELLGAYTENIALFNQFSHADNIYQMRPWYLSYMAGMADTPINFSVYSDSTYLNQPTMDYTVKKNHGKWDVVNRHKDNSGLRYQTYFRGISTRNSSAHWMVGVENFRNTTPFSASDMSTLIFLAVLLSIVSALLGILALNMVMTGAEYAVYLIIIGFLTLRCFLLWRVTVFPPVSSISYFEFNHFRDDSLFSFLKWTVLVFYGVVIGYKLFLALFKFRIRPKFTGDSIYYRSMDSGIGWKMLAGISSKGGVTIVMFLSYIALFCVGIFFRGSDSTFARVINILLPVSVFFFWEYTIFRLHGRTYLQDLKGTENPIKYRLWPVVTTFANIIIVVLYTFFMDGGYGVMFLLFGLIFSIYLVSDLRFYTRKKRRWKAKVTKQDNLILYSEIALFALAILFGLVYKNIFIWVLDNKYVFAAGVFVVLNLVFFLISNVLEFKKQIPWWGWLSCIGITLGISLAVLLFAPKIIDGTHLEYRTRVHMATPSDILQDQIDDFTSQNKFMQASLNDWILQEYADIGKEVKPFNRKSYFKIQPQSKLGAMWFAQTTDIALSRFIIAEHSVLLAILLVIVLFILLIIASFGLCIHRYSRVIQIAVPLLLFLQAGLILFANLRMFIFFGQDFPLISVTSKLSTLYFFVLVFLFMVSLLRETDYVRGGLNCRGRHIRENDRQSISTRDEGTNLKLILAAGCCILIPTLVTYITPKKWNLGPKNRIQVSSLDGRYSLDTLMQSLYDVREQLDSLFIDYQSTNHLQLQTDMYSQMQGFAETPEYQSFQQGLEMSNKFASRVIDRYIKTGSHHNSSKGLIHVRKEIRYDRRGNEHDHLVFGVNDDFYEYQLPKKQSNTWKGSIVGSPNAFSDASSFSGNGVDVTRLKKEWLDGDSDLYLVHSTIPNTRIMGENSIAELGPDDLSVVVVSGKDEILRGGRSVSVPIISRDNYFARNVMVNGTRTFLYPYGSEMFWIRELANSIKSSKETLLRKGDKKEIKNAFFGNVPISISKDLSRSIYTCYMNANASTDKTVVVADGDGHIKAMVDYRGNHKYRLNPNDERTIGKISDHLLMEGLRKSPEYQRYFTTFASAPLRLGPGSSQKPIVWSAVTAGYNSGFWNTLKILPLPTNPIVERSRNGRMVPDYNSGFVLTKRVNGRNRTYFRFPNFAGQRIQRGFQSIASDEGYSDLEIGLEWYMYKSSNYYNATMAYFGMFTKDELNALLSTGIRNNGSGLLRAAPSPTTSDVATNQEHFPIISTSGNNRVSFARHLTIHEYHNPNALLAHGLTQYFSLPLTRKNSNSIYQSIPRYMQTEDGAIEVRPSYSDPSHFNMSIRQENTRPAEMLEVGIHTVAIGNTTSWIVSPVKMAEMYGRLISLNQNYSLTLDPSVQSQYEQFPLDSTWGNTEEDAFDNYRDTRTDFIHGLSKVFSLSDRGTARGVYNNTQNLSELGVYLDTTNEQESHPFYIYGKTGTINGTWDHIDRTDHLLAVIITDTKVSTAETLSDMKFYVIYFADYSTESFESIDAAIVRTVIQSDDFREYMSH